MKKYAFVSPFFSYDPVFGISLPSEWVSGIWERLCKRAWKMGRMFQYSQKIVLWSVSFKISRRTEKVNVESPEESPYVSVSVVWILHPASLNFITGSKSLWNSLDLDVYLYSVSHTVLCTLNKTRLHNLDSETIRVELSLLSDFKKKRKFFLPLLWLFCN